MSQSEPPARAAFAAAQASIRGALAGTIAEVANNLLMRMKGASTYFERTQLAVAQKHVLESHDQFLAAFAVLLGKGIDDDIASVGPARPSSDDTDWQSISLVDDDQIESTIAFKRIGQLIGHASEAELRELDGYASALLGHASADPKRNPLRGDVLGTAIHRALAKTTEGPETQKILAHEFGLAMARAMPGCYREIIDAFKKRGTRPVDLTLRSHDDGGRAPSGSHPAFDQARRDWEQSWVGRTNAPPPPPPPPPPAADTLRSWQSSISGRYGNIDPLPSGYDPDGTAALLDRLMRGALPGSEPPRQSAAPSVSASADEPELMELLRRLNGAAQARGDFERTQRDSGPGALSQARFAPRSPVDARPSSFDGGSVFGSSEQGPATGLSGLVAVNLIRAHREELERTARNRLDHLVIEVVSSLFDQILSDARVPPQMARQIARLQLPVLRVTLVDPTFFSSRRHPVRRFINRIASLACAFDDLDSGVGKELLARVGALVTGIVDGDFDQLELYELKLAELERFTAEETHAQTRASDAAPTLRAKEIEWRVERSFSQRLRAALEPLELPAFVLDFLSGAWAQAIVAASRESGSTGALALERRRIGVALVISLHAKHSVKERQHFVQTLPSLMAGLQNGMEDIAWPKASRHAFFGELVALHTGSLKTAPGTELDRNMTVRQLEAAFKTPLPRPDDAVEAVDEPSAAVPEGALAEQRFSPDEERAIGLVSEEAVEWLPPLGPDSAAGPVDAIAASAARGSNDTRTASSDTPGATGDPASGDLPTIDVGPIQAAARAPAAPAARSAPTESANAPIFPTGSELREQLQLGFPYLLNLKGEWQKVRLTYMSPGRNLFLFSHGAKERETVSMTTRTFDRLCSAGRLRAFETSYLVERSTARARQQLAALGAMQSPAAA